MSADKLLQHLEKVKRTGAHKWQACCPAHDDKGPSLAVSEVEDGRILIHCFAGCGAAEILEAVGMNFCDLYPDKPVLAHMSKRVHKPWNAHDVLAALAYEVLVAWNCAKHLLSGTPLPQGDHDRLLLAASRLQRGHEVCSRE